MTFCPSLHSRRLTVLPDSCSMLSKQVYLHRFDYLRCVSVNVKRGCCCCTLFRAELVIFRLCAVLLALHVDRRHCLTRYLFYFAVCWTNFFLTRAISCIVCQSRKSLYYIVLYFTLYTICILLPNSILVTSLPCCSFYLVLAV